MAFDARRLRRWFALAALLLLLVVAGFYVRGRQAARRASQDIPRQLGVDVQQSTEGFTLSKSEGGRTLFTVRASRAVQFKGGGRAELKDVYIVVRGRRSDRFDQIYGSDFEYDPSTGDITARGEVHIDLETDEEGPERPDQTPPSELKNPVHLKTKGLVFNQKTGIARTREAIEFRIPQASGTAVGVRYNSAANVLTLESKVQVRLSGPSRAMITAESGAISKEPRRVELKAVRIEQGTNRLAADRVAIFLRDDNSVDRVLAESNVRGSANGSLAASLVAPRAEFFVEPRGTLRSAQLSGGVKLDASSSSLVHAESREVILEFAAGNRLAKVRTLRDVRLTRRPQRGAREQALELTAAGVDFLLREGRFLEKAVTSGPAEITIVPPGGASNTSTTRVFAAHLEAAFGKRNRLLRLNGPQAKIIASLPGAPDRISESRQLNVRFSESGRGAIASIHQSGDVRYSEPGRSARAADAVYEPASGELVLTGSPRFVDGPLVTTARTLRLNRSTGEAFAEGDVKTTYTPGAAQPDGALLASADPIHVTARAMTVRRDSALAVYTGGARLWQGANIVQAPAIEFDHNRRSMLARGGSAAGVTTVFVQESAEGRRTPVQVSAARLSYTDRERRVHFAGGVSVRGGDARVFADEVDVFLRPAALGTSSGPGVLERIAAQGNVRVEEGSRRAQGALLVYTAADGKFVLTGDGANRPSIFDAELGSTTGDSLTFFSRDDTVLVDSGTSTRAVTQTRVSK